jgi:hypothetical protein
LITFLATLICSSVLPWLFCVSNWDRNSLLNGSAGY